MQANAGQRPCHFVTLLKVEDKGIEDEEEKEVSQEDEQVLEEGEQDGADHVPDGGECSSDSDGLDANKVLKKWQELKDGHKLER